MSIWYDKGPLCSHQALFYFCLGARGTGKTFAFKEWALKKPGQTVWVRRFAEDIHGKDGNGLLDGDQKFLKDLIAEGKISPDEYAIEGNVLWHLILDDEGNIISREEKIFFIPLSSSSRVKSQNYHDVDIIVFDEFLERNQSKYLKGEVETFLELYETINRLRIDGRRDVRAFFLANNISFINPYFAYWNILPFSERFKTFVDGMIIVENYRNDEFVKLKKESKFGKLINGTRYGNYAIDNVVWLDDDAYIGKRPDWSKHIVALHIEDNYYGVWVDDQRIYISRKYNLENGVYAPMYRCLESERPMKTTTYPMKQIKQFYMEGRLWFEDVVCKNAIFTMMQKEVLE